MEREPHLTALDKAKVALIRKPDSAFFTTLCFSLRQVFDDSTETAACDGRKIYWNKEFFMKLSQEERVFVMLHETMHAAYLHMDPLRKGKRDHHKWNVACDHVINLQLIERGFKMPEIGLADPQYTGMSSEQVYDLLPDNVVPPMSDLKTPDNSSDNSSSGQTDMAQLREEIQNALIRAQIQSKLSGDKAGTIPGEIQIFLDNLLNPKLPWHRILQKYLQTYVKDDYSWRKINRRFFPKHMIPSLHSTALIDVAIAVDTSGSVSDKDFKQFISEAHKVLRMMKPSSMTLIQFDRAIKSVDKLKTIRDLAKVKFFGRGGTCIEPVMEWQQKHRPQVLMIFTDGCFADWKGKPSSDVIWLIHNNPNRNFNYGKVIHYEV